MKSKIAILEAASNTVGKSSAKSLMDANPRLLGRYTIAEVKKCLYRLDGSRRQPIKRQSDGRNPRPIFYAYQPGASPVRKDILGRIKISLMVTEKVRDFVIRDAERRHLQVEKWLEEFCEVIVVEAPDRKHTRRYGQRTLYFSLRRSTWRPLLEIAESLDSTVEEVVIGRIIEEMI